LVGLLRDSNRGHELAPLVWVAFVMQHPPPQKICNGSGGKATVQPPAGLAPNEMSGLSWRQPAIARNLITLARAGEPGALQAIREIADRLDGKPKQEAEVTLRQALARELSDDDLAAIALGAGAGEVEVDPKSDPTKLN
jgi:hypothetical protein